MEGAIDVVAEEKDSVTVLDFKTDVVTAGEVKELNVH